MNGTWRVGHATRESSNGHLPSGRRTTRTLLLAHRQVTMYLASCVPVDDLQLALQSFRVLPGRILPDGLAGRKLLILALTGVFGRRIPVVSILWRKALGKFNAGAVAISIISAEVVIYALVAILMRIITQCMGGRKQGFVHPEGLHALCIIA